MDVQVSRSDYVKIDPEVFRKKYEDEMENTGSQITVAELTYILKDYYGLRGWNELGIPVEPQD